MSTMSELDLILRELDLVPVPRPLAQALLKDLRELREASFERGDPRLADAVTLEGRESRYGLWNVAAGEVTMMGVVAWTLLTGLPGSVVKVRRQSSASPWHLEPERVVAKDWPALREAVVVLAELL